MGKFLKNTAFFAAIVAGFVILGIGIAKRWALQSFDFKVADVNILILGDSHTQCALNDGIIKNSLNLSESADTYFYSYVKLKRMVRYNPQIDTLILGYAGYNITRNQDTWLQDSDINSFKLPIYFFLFDTADLHDFIRINPAQIPRFSNTIFKRNFSHIWRSLKNEEINQFGIGGFLPLTKVMRTSGPLILAKSKPLASSEVDILYLNKIYELCNKRNITLILLSTPTFRAEAYLIKNDDFISYREKNLPNSQFLNFSDFDLPQQDYADAAHLNRKGAEKFSTMLQLQISTLQFQP